MELVGGHGDRVTVVSAASAYHCGGGFLTGGRHAFEEAICTQTTLFPSLEGAKEETDFQQPLVDDQPRAYIPHDGVVLSPKVHVFRHGSDAGYAFMDKPGRLAAVITVAMFNMNPNVRDAPLDAPSDPDLYDDIVRMKFRSLLSAAVVARTSALVMPDVGCGVYRNDASRVGRLFGEVVRREFWGHIKDLVVVGKRDFQDAVQRAVDEHAVVGNNLDL